jgi:hypothetical protein
VTPPPRPSALREELQRARARRWQTERLDELTARIERDGFQEASQAEIDSIFNGPTPERGTTPKPDGD